jgi:hypothetical protein
VGRRHLSEFAALEIESQMHQLSTGDRIMHRISVAVCFCLISFSGLATANDKTPQAWDAKTISWEPPSSNGSKSAVLQGRDGVVGDAYTYAVFVPAGSDPHHSLHSHSTDTRVAVVKGALKLGFGETEELAIANIKSYPVGSYAFVPAGVKHVMAADVATIFIGTMTLDADTIERLHGKAGAHEHHH